MGMIIFTQVLTLSLYTLFVGFCFCDGFKLRMMSKLIWYTIFLGINILTLKMKNDFDFTFILPIPTALAILLCSYEKRASKNKPDNPPSCS